MNGLLCYCRQGFEPELAAELGERAATAGIAGYARASRDDGHVLFVTGDIHSGWACELPLDTSGQVKGGAKFVGFEGLRDYLKTQNDQLTQHFSRKLIGFALGRQLGDELGHRSDDRRLDRRVGSHAVGVTLANDADRA